MNKGGHDYSPYELLTIRSVEKISKHFYILLALLQLMAKVIAD